MFLRFLYTLNLYRSCQSTHDLQGLERLLPSHLKEKFIRSQPLGRIGAVRDISDAAIYLFADTGSYVNGQVLVGKLTFRFDLPFFRMEF